RWWMVIIARRSGDVYLLLSEMQGVLCGVLAERRHDDRRAVANSAAGTGWFAQHCKDRIYRSRLIWSRCSYRKLPVSFGGGQLGTAGKRVWANSITLFGTWHSPPRITSYSSPRRSAVRAVSLDPIRFARRQKNHHHKHGLPQSIDR